MNNNELLQRTRFSLDDPAQFGLERQDTPPDTSMVHAQFLTRHVEVSMSLFPEIAQTVNSACDWLVGENGIHAFISADESMNAMCAPGSDGAPIIWLSSGLIKSLNKSELKFVIGHELGHWHYRHYLYPAVEPDGGAAFMARQQLARASEISCDRIGLLACRDTNSALKAVLKTASGLTDDFMSPRISEYIHQTRALDSSSINQGEVYATHPPMVIRARALLWYSMSREYAEWQGDGTGALDIARVNRRVQRDLESVLGKPFKERQSQVIEEAVLWMTLYELVEDGKLSKDDQELIAKEFGSDVLNKIRGFVSGKSSEQVKLEIREKAHEARQLLSAYPRAAVAEQVKGRGRAARHVQSFLQRFA